MYVLVVVAIDHCFSLMLLLFFELKTAYELRISDWSSDVCSSDRRGRGGTDWCSRRASPGGGACRRASYGGGAPARSSRRARRRRRGPPHRSSPAARRRRRRRRGRRSSSRSSRRAPCRDRKSVV